MTLHGTGFKTVALDRLVLSMTTTSAPAYLCLEGLHNFHVLLDLFAEFLERLWPLLCFHEPILDGLAKFLQTVEHSSQSSPIVFILSPRGPGCLHTQQSGGRRYLQLGQFVDVHLLLLVLSLLVQPVFGVLQF